MNDANEPQRTADTQQRTPSVERHAEREPERNVADANADSAKRGSRDDTNVYANVNEDVSALANRAFEDDDDQRAMRVPSDAAILRLSDSTEVQVVEVLRRGDEPLVRPIDAYTHAVRRQLIFVPVGNAILCTYA